MIPYKGYTGSVVFDDEADILHGEVLGIRDVVTFQARSVDELQKTFHASVDDYLAFCKERNEEPDRPFSGKLNLRLEPETHRRCAIQARRAHKSLNAWIVEALEKAAAG